MYKRRAESKKHPDQNNYKEQIHAFTQQVWLLLIEMTPKVESNTKFCEWACGEKREKETIPTKAR
ncbi:uncharacterized protein METZ01_LOCUS414295 [marine metagenome]|uniref:Uncharacterized protein n=1 Tax=marine metagenome TaxID=408172 RepID=A0A382WTT2_9ZZZZ